MKKITSLFLFLLLALMARAGEDPNNVEMADVMRSNGKIYVVLAVVLVILAGLLLYLVSIDRKVTQLEKEQNKK